jgi:hypothetical protein
VKLKILQPVTYHYKNDRAKNIQYGLIAEDVNKILPEIVVNDENGKIIHLRYDQLVPILLQMAIDNENDKQKIIEDFNTRHIALETQIIEMQKTLANLN